MTILNWNEVQVGMVVQGLTLSNGSRSSSYFQPNVVMYDPTHPRLRILSPESSTRFGWYVNNDCKYEELL